MDIRHGDCLKLMAELEPASVDAIVTDPPYGLEFMGKEWDRLDDPVLRRRGQNAADAAKRGYNVSALVKAPGFDNSVEAKRAAQEWHHAWAVEALRVAKPGAHLVAFGGTRTFHRLTCALEDAGWEIRDCLCWLYGQGFPKSLDVSKAIDKAAGTEREVVGPNPTYRKDQSEASSFTLQRNPNLTAPATDAARQWAGWGTALKPAYEPVILARKPLDMAGELAILVPTIERELCKVATFAKTDTPSSEPLRACGFLSIVSSLSKCLADLSEQANRLTTATAFALTTDLRILSCSLSRLTRAITTEDWSATSGVASDAWLAAGISRSVLAKCERLTFTTADELAIGLHASEADDPEGSRLSPDWLPIILARKPLIGTVVANVQEHGTGALNIDGCRIEAPLGDRQEYGIDGDESAGRNRFAYSPHDAARTPYKRPEAGRWPANVVLECICTNRNESESKSVAVDMIPSLASSLIGAQSMSHQVGCPAGMLDQQSQTHSAGAARDGMGAVVADSYAASSYELSPKRRMFRLGDLGGASRFFYTAKAASSERHYAGKNTHPTVKPVDLMRWLCRLVTPPGGLILDPFCGSGSTGIAALGEGFRFLGMEQDEEMVRLARKRIAGPLFADPES